MMQLLLPVLVLAQEAPSEDPSGIHLLIPETSELIAGVLAFAIVFLAVWKWALPAVNRTLEARRAAITGQVAEAEQTKAEAESLLEDYKQQLAEARSHANAIVDEAKVTAEAVRSGIVSKAEAEAAEISRKTRDEIAAERERAAGEIRSEIAALSFEMAQKASAGAMNEDAHRALVDQFLDELEEME
jgi:F-type H+-transporting ATPase subunit b